jgi:hypothetical protein
MEEAAAVSTNWWRRGTDAQSRDRDQTQDRLAMLYDNRPLNRASKPSYRKFLFEIVIVLMASILLLVAVMSSGYREAFYFKEGGTVEATALLAP